MLSIFSRVKNFVSQNSKKNKIRQVVLLYSVNLVGIPLGIITSIIITRYLGVQGYGDYQFILNIFNLSIIFFSFGFLQAGNRVLVLNSDPRKAKEYYGAELVLIVFLFLAMSLFLFFYGVYDSNLRQKGLDSFFLKLLPFSWIFLLVRYFEVLFQADNKIRLLASSRLWPKVGFLVSAILIYFFFYNSTGKHVIVWTLYLLTQAIVFITIIVKVSPSFKSLWERIGEIWEYNKAFGLQVYAGSVMAVGFSQLTGVLISYFGVNNVDVGHYSLAVTFASPLVLIPNVIATTHYKDFSTKRRIPCKLMLVTLGLSLFSLLGLWVVVPIFVRAFYSADFEPVIRLNLVVSLGVALHGIADLYNRFLGAHGQGKALRNSSFLVGLSLMFFNLLFIPKLGAIGAAITKISTGVIYCGVILVYYFRLQKSIEGS